MKKHIFVIVAFCLAALVPTGCSDDIATEKNSDAAHGVITMNARFDEPSSRVSLETDGLNLVGKWEKDDSLRICLGNADGSYTMAKIPTAIYDISSDRKSCWFSFHTPMTVSAGSKSEYHCFGFTSPCAVRVLSEKTGSMLLADASLRRTSLQNFHAPVFFDEMVHEGVGNTVVFHHYLTYEVLHVKNTSDQAISVALIQPEAEEYWYNLSGDVNVENGEFYLKDEGLSYLRENSDTISIPAHDTGVFVSSYSANGNKISDVRLRMIVNGDTITTSNSFSSETELKPARAYHMYAEWNGENLAFPGFARDDANKIKKLLSW